MSHSNPYQQNMAHSCTDTTSQTPDYAMSNRESYNYQPSSQVFLMEAFPNVDPSTVKAILASTKGEVDPAFSALLAISNPQTRPSGPLQHNQQSYSSQTQASYHSSPHPPLDSTSQPFPLNHYASSPGYLQPQAPPPPPPPQYYTSPVDPAVSSHSPYPSPFAASPNHGLPGPIPNLCPPTAMSPYPAAPPSLHTTYGAPPQYGHSASAPSLPDMSQLNLYENNHYLQGESSHWASCDGCSQDPIRGVRWRCVKCPDYDLCQKCRDAGIHQDHLMEQCAAWAETHNQVECDGCKISCKTIIGPRYQCQQHEDEDFCERCVRMGQACHGPFKIIRQTEMGQQLERQSCVPMPEGWLVYLRPAVATYNIECAGSGKWIEWPSELKWYNKTKRERRRKANDPVYKVEIKNTKGRFVSENKYSWVMKRSDGTKTHCYTLERDRKTNAVKSEKFGEYKGKSFTPVWRHGPQIDSLTFEDPQTGQPYRWLTNRSVSTLNDERFDYQRYALFQTKFGGEAIVADFTWWDGDKRDPEDALTIRDPHVDHAMVIASLCMVHDHQWEIMNEEAIRDPQNLSDTERNARLTRMGCTSYWHASDFGAEMAQATHLTTAQKLHTANGVLEVANGALSLASAVSGASSGGGGGC